MIQINLKKNSERLFFLEIINMKNQNENMTAGVMTQIGDTVN